MIEQTFSIIDIPKIFTLSFLELLLSADNAVVLAVLSHSLPPPLRKKALYIGIGSAFVLRAGALLALSYLLKSKWIQVLGCGYLLYLSIRYFLREKKPLHLKPQESFWKVVFLIEILDLVFAIDSIVAGIAFINDNLAKLWIVYFGGVLGIAGMRYAAHLFGMLLDLYPHIEASAYLMVGWIGFKLGLSALGYPLPPLLFWSAILLFFLLGFIRK